MRIISEVVRKRKWIFLALLSIAVPMILLATLRLTRILQEPLVISETKTLEAVKWEIERPHRLIDVKHTVKSFYSDEDISINYSVFVHGFHREISMSVNTTATANQGFIGGLNITFWEDYNNSEVRFFQVHAWPKIYSHVENLSIDDYAHHLQGRGLKAFIELVGLNHPKRVHFHGVVQWFLRSPKNQTHQMEIATELIYFNGTAYKKIVQSFQLEVRPDDNNSFETAEQIEEETYPWLYVDYTYDREDYYKIDVTEGQRIYAVMKILQRPDQDFNLYLYDPSRNLKGESKRGAGYTDSIDFVADSTGSWYIKVNATSGDFGFYTLRLDTNPTDV